MKRTFFIGDIHGCAEELSELFEKISPSADDEVYQAGDLINKGPDSIEVVKFVLKHKIKCVMGNHEAKLLNILKKAASELNAKETRFLERIGDPEWIASVVSEFPLWLDTGREFLLHAGLEPDKERIEDMDAKSILSMRLWNGLPWYEQTSIKERTIIFSHWAANGLVDFPHAKGLDTGCVYGKLLTGYCPEEERFYQIAAKKAYAAF